MTVVKCAPPIVERVAGWSARHRKIAVVGWLLLVAVAFTLGQRLGTRNLNSYDPGRAGRPNVCWLAGSTQPTGESVLIQARRGQSFGTDPGCGRPPGMWSPRCTACRGPPPTSGRRSPPPG